HDQRSALQVEQDAAACRMALKLLMFLVLEHLMPVRASVETTRHSLFSRHFYSTLQSALDLDRWDEQNRRKDDEGGGPRDGKLPPPLRNVNPSLLALPFFPLGLREKGAGANEWEILLEDLRDRLQRLQARGERWLKEPEKEKTRPAAKKSEREKERQATLTFWNAQFAKLKLPPGAPIPAEDQERSSFHAERSAGAAPEGPAPTGGVQPPASFRLEALRELAEASVTVFTELMDPPDPYVTLPPDLVELMKWHLLRIRLLCHPGSLRLSEILSSYDHNPFLPLGLGDLKTGAPPPVATGFGCTGSWMYGIHGSARSASLAREVLQEITSLSAAEERARRGAGIPTRRDFFELHGLDDVPSMEYLNWNQLLRYCASRARRRERVLPTGMSEPARVYKVIQQQMLACLDRAAHWSKEYDEGKAGAVIDETKAAAKIGAVIVKAEAAATHAVEMIKSSVKPLPKA
ncbi:MAG TPA: hypothetical protein VGO11_16440, partial [Chthoniobacteraceae bacterium]|nr:hypothetical protein [Chthoniobacteraceae bacterium]